LVVLVQAGAHGGVVEDFEDAALKPKVWTVNFPGERASAEVLESGAHGGKRGLVLRYAFDTVGQFQYLGIPTKVRIEGPAGALRFWLRGDGSRCSYGVQVTDCGGETHQFSQRFGQCGIIDFKGWREVVVDLTKPHETWGGDKNGRLDFPITGVAFTVGQPVEDGARKAIKGELAFDDLRVDAEKAAERWRPQLSVKAPAYGGTVRGDTLVRIGAGGFGKITARCIKADGLRGADAVVAEVKPDGGGEAGFMFPADDFPHGPITLRLHGEGDGIEDNCYLQLYNLGGAPWKEGMPRTPPPAARGMRLVFADDFNGSPTISTTNPAATYYDHKPGGGDFSSLPFAGFQTEANPFFQTETWLRIRASEAAHSAGLLSSLKPDGSGVTAAAPCYFECRFIGPNAPGTWPAFWLLTDYIYERGSGGKPPVDELDIIEAYGGEGPGRPNAGDAYMVTPHAWEQGEPGKALEKAAFEAMRNPVRMGTKGVGSAWFEAFHTYGCKITETDTIYYCDDVEVGRHATLPESRRRRFFFLINLATGGGWPVDLSRYGGTADMYVDYVRVYQGGR
jgi:Glycosyl hydrolases family 16